MKLTKFFVYFIPKIDQRDGNLIYTAESFIKIQNIEKIIVIMPYEFSITLENEREEIGKEASKIVKLTFWDLLKTFNNLTLATNFIIYHNKSLDEIGRCLEGYKNRFWGASEDHILDDIYISRQLYQWLLQQIEDAEDQILIQKVLKFHKRNGIVDIDENDELQKPLFERAVLMKRNEYKKRGRLHSTVMGVAKYLEEKAILQAAQFWEELKNEGKLLYYPPGELPLL